jgi:hypothetical protein
MTFLTSGSLTLGFKPLLGTNDVTLGSAISSFIGTPTNYFQTNGTGKVIRTVPTGSNLLFPVGKASYNPLNVKNNTGSQDVFSVRVLDSVFLEGTSGSLITTPHVKATWDIYKTNANAGSGVDFVFGWNPSQEVGSFTSYKLNHYASSNWSFASGTSGTPSGTSTKTMSHTGYTGTFSPFAISEGTFALPVELTTFNTNCTEVGTEINWQTASEHNSATFDVAKSRDGSNWSVLETVQAAGNSTSLLDYAVTDTEQVSGIVYYRLNQVDQNGASKIFGPISANCFETTDFTAIVFPNPCATEVTLSIVSQIPSEVNYILISPEGKVLENKQMSVQSGITLFNLDVSNYPSGMYILQFEVNDKRFIKKLTLQ